MQRHYQRSRGGTLFVALTTIAICSILVGIYLKALIPAYRSAHQGVSWREALHGAEAGVNHAINQLNQLAASSGNADSYPWAANGWSFLDATFSLNGERILQQALLPILGGPNSVAVTQLSMDVYTRQPEEPYHPWFRIRSTGKADLPDRFLSMDRRDGRLRRMKLAAMIGGKSAPHVSRTVEVIVKPRNRFTRAITTVEGMKLGGSDGWNVDSFDSNAPDKSDAGTAAGGVYPQDPAERGSSGHIASAETRPEHSPYGALIDGSGARVDGDVQTAGGDNPATPQHENVSGSSGMDQSRIRDNFDEDIPPAPNPKWTVALPPPLGNTNFVPGTSKLPTRYVVNGNLGPFQVLPAVPGTTGYVEIRVNGNLDLGNGSGAQIVIPPNVKATIYVDGNIDFSNGQVNSGEGSSKVASHLTVFGISDSPAASYKGSGSGEQTLSFYGPNYAVRLDGAVKTVGAMVAKSFSVNGGGSGGFHYDEALGRVSDIMGWIIVSYFEDTRGG